MTRTILAALLAAASLTAHADESYLHKKYSQASEFCKAYSDATYWVVSYRDDNLFPRSKAIADGLPIFGDTLGVSAFTRIVKTEYAKGVVAADKINLDAMQEDALYRCAKERGEPL